MSRKFQCKAIPSTWLQSNGRRLDCGPYLSGAMEARELLNNLKGNKEPLSSLTTGIYHAGRERRLWVNSLDYGVPFMGSTDILASDLSSLPLISKKQVKANLNFTIHAGWTLITRSGTIGRMAFARSDMDGIACSEHVMRVVPKSDVKSGYIYAYLSSRFGVPLIVSGTYGSIIQSIEPHHISDLPVPRLGDVETEAHDLVQNAAENRVQASKLIKEAVEETYLKLNIPVLPNDVDIASPSLTIQKSSNLLQRMDSYYYSDVNLQARREFDEAAVTHGGAALGDKADVWIPNIFKRLYVDDHKYGRPYFTGKELYELSPSTDLYLKEDVAEKNRLIISKGMLLIQDSGQLSGLIGRPVQVGKHLHGSTCTNNMVRVHAKEDYDNGYLFGLLSTRHGVKLLKREAAGSSIPHLEERRMKSVRIPWPSEEIRKSIGKKVIQALELRDEAIDAENSARALVERTIEDGGR